MMGISDDIYEALGRQIRQRRRQQKLTQIDMAIALRMSQSAYSRIESGKSSVSVLQLQRIAECFDMTAAEILDEVAV